jgi:hypothetical protein
MEAFSWATVVVLGFVVKSSQKGAKVIGGAPEFDVEVVGAISFVYQPAAPEAITDGNVAELNSTKPFVFTWNPVMVCPWNVKGKGIATIADILSSVLADEPNE